MKEYAILLFRSYIIDMMGMCTVQEICLIKRLSLLQRIANSGLCLSCQMLSTLILLIIQERKILAQTSSFIECFGSHNWKIVPRLLGSGIGEAASRSFLDYTASSCAMQCQISPSCQLFRFNAHSSVCDLYDGRGYKRVSNVQGNQFYQRMPDGNIAYIVD